MRKAESLTVVPVVEPDELFVCNGVEYTRPWPVYVQLDLVQGTLSISPVPPDHAVPEAVRHNRSLRSQVTHLTAKDANRLLETIADRAREVFGEARIEHDGMRWYGWLTPVGNAQWALIEQAARDWTRDGERVGAMPAAAWFTAFDDAASYGLTPDTSEADISRICNKIRGEIREMTPEVFIPIGFREHLEDAREEMRGAILAALTQLRDQLRQRDLDPLHALERREMVRRIAQWGTMPSADLAGMAGMDPVDLEHVLSTSDYVV